MTGIGFPESTSEGDSLARRDPRIRGRITIDSTGGHRMESPAGGFAAAQLAAMRQGTVMRRPDVLEHYRHLWTTFVEHAKRLGLAVGYTLIVDAEMTLVFDLAIHTAKVQLSKANGRKSTYERSTPGGT
jgi:hypothetical protein